MILSVELIEIIEKTIREIESDYQKIQGLILTEDDLKCILFSRLLKVPEIGIVSKTKDNLPILSISLHAEVSWYDDQGKLTIKPDLTILEPEFLFILKGSQEKRRLPSKQFGFSGKAIIFELKFIRNTTGITLKKLRDEIEADFNKIQRLFQILDNQHMSDEVFCFFVIFNKTNIICKEFQQYLQDNRESSRHKIIYSSGNVVFPKADNHKK